MVYRKKGIAEWWNEYKWGGYPACGENIRNEQDAPNTKLLKSSRIYATPEKGIPGTGARCSHYRAS
ncbi:MAG: hypothetical protein F6K24_33525 [Okeania sp. SIO2D1]|nr:hypothetical protein [Okeania sp. SIO2D1]